MASDIVKKLSRMIESLDAPCLTPIEYMGVLDNLPESEKQTYEDAITNVGIGIRSLIALRDRLK